MACASGPQGTGSVTEAIIAGMCPISSWCKSPEGPSAGTGYPRLRHNLCSQDNSCTTACARLATTQACHLGDRRFMRIVALLSASSAVPNIQLTAARQWMRNGTAHCGVA